MSAASAYLVGAFLSFAVAITLDGLAKAYTHDGYYIVAFGFYFLGISCVVGWFWAVFT